MEYAVFTLVWVVNFALSVWNAYAVGRVWVEAKHAGGWPRFVCWMGAVMSAAGFTWCYLSFLVMLGSLADAVSVEQARFALNLGYVLLIPCITFSGYAITLDSWANAYRNGGYRRFGIAGWNTYASVHNTYSMWRTFGRAFASLGHVSKGGSQSSRSKGNSGAGIIVVVLLVGLAACAGIITTATIIRRVAGTAPLPPQPTDGGE